MKLIVTLTDDTTREVEILYQTPNLVLHASVPANPAYKYTITLKYMNMVKIMMLNDKRVACRLMDRLEKKYLTHFKMVRLYNKNIWELADFKQAIFDNLFARSTTLYRIGNRDYKGREAC